MSDLEKKIYDLHVQAYTLESSGRYQEAYQLYDEILALDPDYSDAYANQGVILSTLRRYADAIPLLEKALQLDPNNGVIYNNLGHCYRMIGQVKKAIILLKLALENGYQHEGVNYNLAVALLNDGRITEGLEQYEIALQKNPSYAPALNDLDKLARGLGIADSFQETSLAELKKRASKVNLKIA